jgi:hypothetical protein
LGNGDILPIRKLDAVHNVSAPREPRPLAARKNALEVGPRLDGIEVAALKMSSSRQATPQIDGFDRKSSGPRQKAGSESRFLEHTAWLD